MSRNTENGISRREFHKLFSLAGAFTIGSIYAPQITSFLLQFEFLPQNDQIRRLQLRPPPPYMRDVVGIMANTPFLHTRDEEVITRSLSKVKTLHGRNIIVFLTSDFEPQVGDYQKEVLESISRLNRMVDDASDGQMGTIICLFDGFPMFHIDNQENYVFPIKPRPTSPYLDQSRNLEDPLIKIPEQQNFFRLGKNRQALMNRFEYTMNYFKDDKTVKGWEIINESVVPVLYPEHLPWAREIHSNWFLQMALFTLSLDNTRPIFTGLADANAVDRRIFKNLPVLETHHSYPFFTNQPQKELRSQLRPSGSHIGLTEFGIPKWLLTPKAIKKQLKLERIYLDMDTFSHAYLNRLIKIATFGDIFAPPVMAPWMQDFGYDDGFLFDPDDNPKTLATFDALHQVYINAMHA